MREKLKGSPHKGQVNLGEMKKPKQSEVLYTLKPRPPHPGSQHWIETEFTNVSPVCSLSLEYCGSCTPLQMVREERGESQTLVSPCYPDSPAQNDPR